MSLMVINVFAGQVLRGNGEGEDRINMVMQRAGTGIHHLTPIVALWVQL